MSRFASRLALTGLCLAVLVQVSVAIAGLTLSLTPDFTSLTNRVVTNGVAEPRFIPNAATYSVEPYVQTLYLYAETPVAEPLRVTVSSPSGVAVSSTESIASRVSTRQWFSVHFDCSGRPGSSQVSVEVSNTTGSTLQFGFIKDCPVAASTIANLNIGTSLSKPNNLLELGSPRVASDEVLVALRGSAPLYFSLAANQAPSTITFSIAQQGTSSLSTNQFYSNATAIPLVSSIGSSVTAAVQLNFNCRAASSTPPVDYELIDVDPELPLYLANRGQLVSIDITVLVPGYASVPIRLWTICNPNATSPTPNNEKPSEDLTKGGIAAVVIFSISAAVLGICGAFCCINRVVHRRRGWEMVPGYFLFVNKSSTQVDSSGNPAYREEALDDFHGTELSQRRDDGATIVDMSTAPSEDSVR